MFRTLEAFSLLAKRWWPAVLWMILIVLASLDWASGGHTLPILHTILKWLNPDVQMRDVYDFNIIFRKSCHFLQFFILVFLIWRTRGSWRSVSPKADLRFSFFVLAVCAVLAIGSEVIQHAVISRSPSARDVVINMSGAGIGILASLAIEAILGLRRPTSRQPASGRTSRILLTADVHLDSKPSNYDTIRQAIETHRPELFIVAGNIGSPLNARSSLKMLKEAAGSTPVAICLGSHDHWLPPEYWEKYPSPSTVREKLWQPALSESGMLGLDFQNLATDSVIITGGYGHFDLGFRDPSLLLDNEPVSLQHYLQGSAAGLECADMKQIPHADQTLQKEADLQAAGIATRLAEACQTNLPVLLVTGTAAHGEWAGYNGNLGSPMNFFRAYAGNSLLGPLLRPYAGKICLAVCGHTHKPASQIIDEIHGINVGQYQGKLRFTLIEPEAGEVRLTQVNA